MPILPSLSMFDDESSSMMCNHKYSIKSTHHANIDEKSVWFVLVFFFFRKYCVMFAMNYGQNEKFAIFILPRSTLNRPIAQSSNRTKTSSINFQSIYIHIQNRFGYLQFFTLQTIIQQNSYTHRANENIVHFTKHTTIWQITKIDAFFAFENILFTIPFCQPNPWKSH